MTDRTDKHPAIAVAVFSALVLFVSYSLRAFAGDFPAAMDGGALALTADSGLAARANVKCGFQYSMRCSTTAAYYRFCLGDSTDGGAVATSGSLSDGGRDYGADGGCGLLPDAGPPRLEDGGLFCAYTYGCTAVATDLALTADKTYDLGMPLPSADFPATKVCSVSVLSTTGANTSCGVWTVNPRTIPAPSQR